MNSAQQAVGAVTSGVPELRDEAPEPAGACLGDNP